MPVSHSPGGRLVLVNRRHDAGPHFNLRYKTSCHYDCQIFDGGANVTTLEKVSTGIRTSRRNLIKVGAIAGTAALARLTTPRAATAGGGNGQGGNGQGGNGQGGNGQDGNGQGGNGQGGNGQGGNGQGGNGCFLKGTNIRTAEGDRDMSHSMDRALLA